MLRHLIRTAAFSTNARRNGELIDMLQDVALAEHLPRSDSSHVFRPFKPGQIVKPYDLSYKGRSYEFRHSRRPQVAPPAAVCRHRDVFHQLNIDPRDHSTNSYLLTDYVSEMGKIYGRNITSLTAKNQRLLGKTIRRAKMMGIIPHLSRAHKIRR